MKIQTKFSYLKKKKIQKTPTSSKCEKYGYGLFLFLF